MNHSSTVSGILFVNLAVTSPSTTHFKRDEFGLTTLSKANLLKSKEHRVSDNVGKTFVFVFDINSNMGA